MSYRNRRTYLDYNPVSISPVEGWRVVWIHDPGDGAPGWSAQPLVGWAVFEVTECPIKGEAGTSVQKKREIHGVTAEESDSSWISCVAEVANFWRYLAPGAPDPTEEEVIAEQNRRKQN